MVDCLHHARHHPLDNAAWGALTGPHASLAERHGGAARYPADVAPFAALPDAPSPSAWADLAALSGPGAEAVLFRGQVDPPPAWEVVGHGPGVQMVATALDVVADPQAARLGPEHAGEMLDLVARTRPGPFFHRTPLLGTYLGIRDGDGLLVAMAGERLHLEGWTEISAVCTDERHRGVGLASRLVRAVAAAIVARGEVPFLHAAATNVPAIRLYASMGFTLRREVTFVRLRAPGGLPFRHGTERLQPADNRRIP